MKSTILMLVCILCVSTALETSPAQAAAAVLAANERGLTDQEYTLEENGYVSNDQMVGKFDSYYVIPMISWGRAKIERQTSQYADITEMVACLPGFEYSGKGRCQILDRRGKVVSTQNALTPSVYVDKRSGGYATWVGASFTKVVERSYGKVSASTSLILFYNLSESTRK
ncbi:hypothetical protein AB6D11_00200 [Vibrio splendidus]